ncbi:hypothetical protein PIB30_037558 [Stylosanthes scabra]|uniref:Uncharacterized protein n=1 Tax=Stylosanthes scabra TaxID=79078 RepID=A0ABU6TER9_9FABA|nr:hypothetical protein [Stylosanthes scabra]
MLRTSRSTKVSRSTYLTGNLRFSPLSFSLAQDIIIEKISSERGGSRIPRATCSSSPTDSTVSSATSRPKRQRDHTHEDEHSDGARPRSPCMRATAYRRLFARGASSQGVVCQTDRVLPAPVLPTTPASTPTVHIPDIPGSTVPRMSFVSPPEGPAEVCGDCSRQD